MNQSKTEQLEILGTFLSWKKKILINQKQQVTLRGKITLNVKTIKIETKNYQLKNILIKLEHI